MSRRVTLPALAVAATLLLGACGGSKDATRGSVEDAVRGRLDDLEDPITGGEADAIATCVSSGLFDTDRFSPDERKDATTATDGNEPGADLTGRVSDLVDECKASGGDTGGGDE